MAKTTQQPCARGWVRLGPRPSAWHGRASCTCFTTVSKIKLTHFYRENSFKIQEGYRMLLVDPDRCVTPGGQDCRELKQEQPCFGGGRVAVGGGRHRVRGCCGTWPPAALPMCHGLYSGLEWDSGHRAQGPLAHPGISDCTLPPLASRSFLIATALSSGDNATSLRAVPMLNVPVKNYQHSSWDSLLSASGDQIPALKHTKCPGPWPISIGKPLSEWIRHLSTLNQKHVILHCSL